MDNKRRGIKMTLLTNEIIQEILDTGLIILGAKKCGKSNTAKIIASEMIKNPNFHIRIFDPCNNWVHEFEPIVYTRMNEDTRYYYSGNKNVLYDLEYVDAEEAMVRIGQIVLDDYEKQRWLKNNGGMKKWVINFIEEAQDVLGRYSLSRNTGKLWMKLVSQGRNFNLAFVMIGQRGSDLSASVVERAQGYLFGRASGENDRRKIRRIVGDARIKEQYGDGEEWKRVTGEEIADEVARLDRGQFIYFNGQFGRLIQFPLYKSDNKPLLMVREK